MKIVVLDAITLGEDLDISKALQYGEMTVYDNTNPDDVAYRINEADVIFVNKVRLNEENLKDAKNLKLICEAATGYDNIDTAYCKRANIAVCNVPGYSVHSVAQVTVSMVLYLANHLPKYTGYTKSDEYSSGKGANILKPVFSELYGKTWGIVGYGAIGKKVAEVARAFGCNILAYKRTPVDDVKCCDIDYLMENSDIISVHIPLSDATRGLISQEKIAKMKKSAILVNTARGLVTDEKALCTAVKEGKIAGFGTDVYSLEPFPIDSPFYEIKDLDNVCLTPHMAWGAKEARERCFNEMLINMQAFFNGEERNRV